jgi:predicted dehydrogenase
VTICGCYEEDEESKVTAQKELTCDFNYASYEEMLNDERVEIIGIGDYYQRRGQLIIDALKHGKHVICDKPLCTELSELEQIEQLVKETGLKVGCMLELRFMGAAEKAKELIEEGVLGDLTAASFTGQHFLNYKNRAKWYFEPGKHGGTINDIAVHGVDLLRYMTGKELTEINCAKTWNKCAPLSPDFMDGGQFMIEMDGMSVMADTSYTAAAVPGAQMPTYWSFHLWGTKGMANFRFGESEKLHLYIKEEQVIECKPYNPLMLADFMNEIAGLPSILTTESVLESARQTLMIQKAAK